MLSATSQAVSRTHMRRVLLPFFYLLSVAIVSHTLLTAPQMEQPYLYLYLYPLSLLIAWPLPNHNLKLVAALISLSCIIVAVQQQAVPSGSLEHTFVLIPLIYLMLFPGSLWPAGASVLLVIASIPQQSTDTTALHLFAQDALELVTISLLATVGVYYQQKLHAQVERYRNDNLTDALTGLANRKAFLHDCMRLENSRQDSAHYALLQLDIDDFKLINDTLGHKQGDRLLAGLAQRLSGLNRASGKLYRLSGDEFALILQGEQIRTQADQIAREIISVCRNAFYLDQRCYTVSVSIGVALFDDAMYDHDIWCRNADIALLRAKQKGKSLIQHFDEQLIGETIRDYQLERELANAITRDQLTLVYQPKVDILSGRVDSAEALIRWHHPDLGQVSPEQFVAIAEKSQQIIPIGRWVIETACRQASLWQQQGQSTCIAVNVSAVQFLYDDIFSVVTQSLQDTKLDPNLLQLEITETTMIQQPLNVSQTCQELRKLGVRIAIDDFGIAYSSLNYLKQLPVDVVKIDKSFIDDCVNDHHDHMLVRTIIQLGHNLGKIVTAEGVNNPQQLALLAAEKCDEYQGYYYSPPLPGDDFVRLINAQSQAPKQLQAR